MVFLLEIGCFSGKLALKLSACCLCLEFGLSRLVLCVGWLCDGLVVLRLCGFLGRCGLQGLLSFVVLMFLTDGLEVY